MTAEIAIQIRNLQVRYGDFQAVAGLDLDIYQGELFGLLGPNGAGKSTTVRVLIGQRLPDGGSVQVLGRNVVTEWHYVKPLFGYVPDRDNHFDEFTGRRNLQIFADLYNVPRSRVNECLAEVFLLEAADIPVRGYSMGMKKKLLLARALLHDPAVMYLDEPTANLDIGSAEVVHQILQKRVQAGKTVLLTTHNMPEVEAICTRVGIMAHGQLIALDSPIKLRQQHTERRCDVILNDGTRRVFDMDLPLHREELAKFMQMGLIESVHTREFDFHSTFLKLTGTEFI
ncbi:MAG: ABC transporter ATP-binding protein [Zavarzinella sp.]